MPVFWGKFLNASHGKHSKMEEYASVKAKKMRNETIGMECVK
jgi:hypothetical protein